MSAIHFVNTMLNIPTMTASQFAAAWPFPETDDYLAHGASDITGAHARPNGIMIVHVRKTTWSPSGAETHMRGGATIAYRPANNNRNCRMVQVAVAYCSPNDHFNRKLGSAMAVEKFLNGETILVQARNPLDPDMLPLTLRDMFGQGL